jgi:hypothetical protein
MQQTCRRATSTVVNEAPPSLRSRCHFSTRCSQRGSRPGPAAFPAGPRGRPRETKGNAAPGGRSQNRCEGESCHSSLTAGAHQRDFEGPRVERLRAGAHSEALITMRAPAAGPPPAGGDERGAWKSRPCASLSLRRAIQRRPGWESLRPGRSVPTREAARHRGDSEGNNVWRDHN